MHRPQFPDPLRNDSECISSDFHEVGPKRLGELGSHRPRVLIDEAAFKVDMPELKRRECAHARGSERCERDKCPVAPLDNAIYGHSIEHVMDLFE